MWYRFIRYDSPHTTIDGAFMVQEKKRLFIFFLICVECCTIFFIWKYFFHKPFLPQQNVLSRSLLTFVPDAKLQYYYLLAHHSNDTVTAWWLPEKVTYHYNNDGLADPIDYPVKKDDGAFRIMTLGDSFVFGMWVNQRDNFSELLETWLNTRVTCPTIQKFEVINLGAPGFDVRYTVKRYEDIGAKYNPDLLVWFLRGENIFMNADIYHQQEEFYKKELQAPGGAKRYQVDVNDPYAASSLSFKEYMDSFNRLSSDKKETFIQPEILAMQTLIQQKTSPLLFLTLQDEQNEYKIRINHFVSTDAHIAYEEIAGVDTFAPYDYHPNVLGHTQIMRAIIQFLTSDILKSCTIQ